MNPKKHKRVKAHQRYKLKDGTLIVGITTVCNLLNKGALVKWANNLGLEGIEVNKYTDELADIGSYAHDYISYLLKGEQPPKELDKEYTLRQIEAAQPCIAKFKQWADTHNLKPILIEQPLISEEHRYGGTLDLYCELDSKKTLLDWKTGSGLYETHKIQLSANRQLLEENGHKVDDCKLIGISRNEKEDTKVVDVGGLNWWFKIFLCLLEIYRIRKYKLRA